MTVQELQEYFLNNIFVKKIFEQYEVMFIFVGGSYLTPFFEPNKSDFDINIIVKDKLPDTRINQHDIFFLQYHGIKIHWYINEFGNFFNEEFIGLINLYVKCFNLNNQCLLYLNPKYQQYWDFFYLQKDKIAKYNLFLSAKVVRNEYIRSVVEHRPFLKTLYSLFWGASYFGLCAIGQDQINYYKTHYNNLSVMDIERFYKLYALIWFRLQSQSEEMLQLQQDLQHNLKLLEDNING